jgi:hypothetical protein
VIEGENGVKSSAAQLHRFAGVAISRRRGSVGQQPQEQGPDRSDRNADEKNGTEDDERDQRRRSIGTGGHGASIARQTAARATGGPNGEIASGVAEAGGGRVVSLNVIGSDLVVERIGPMGPIRPIGPIPTLNYGQAGGQTGTHTGTQRLTQTVTV